MSQSAPRVTEFARHLASLPPEKRLALACRANPALWATHYRGFVNAPFHEEWYRLMRFDRLAVIAPREHAKTEIFTVNGTAHRSIYTAGLWTFVFAQTGDQAEKIKARIDEAIRQVKPSMLDGATTLTTKETVYANGAMVTVAGAGKSVRGAHPDVIIGDDVLEEGLCNTSYQRKKTANWWNGTVANMAHPPTKRTVRGIMREFKATKVHLVGTPFHRQDLLMSMKDNPIYTYRRYAAEFNPYDLVDGYAVEAS